MITPVRYVAQSGDAVYTIPDPGAFGFAFSRGTDPSGATLPVAVVQRNGRVYDLRAASVYDVPNAVYVGLTPFSSAYGLSLAAFLSSVQLAWNRQTGASGSDAAPPATLAAGARVWGWVAA